MREPTVADRLGIRPGVTLWFSPIEWLRLLGPLPAGVTMTGEFAAATVAVTFVSNAASVQWLLRRYGTVITMPPAVWICSPTVGSADFNQRLSGDAAGQSRAAAGGGDPGRRRVDGRAHRSRHGLTVAPRRRRA